MAIISSLFPVIDCEHSAEYFGFNCASFLNDSSNDELIERDSCWLIALVLSDEIEAPFKGSYLMSFSLLFRLLVIQLKWLY